MSRTIANLNQNLASEAKKVARLQENESRLVVEHAATIERWRASVNSLVLEREASVRAQYAQALAQALAQMQATQDMSMRQMHAGYESQFVQFSQRANALQVRNAELEAQKADLETIVFSLRDNVAADGPARALRITSTPTSAPLSGWAGGTIASTGPAAPGGPVSLD